MLRVTVFLVLITVILSLPLRAEAGLLGSLGRLADNAGDAGSAARKVDGIGGTDLPASALRAAKDPNTTPLALGVDADGTLRLSDELGRTVDLSAGADLDSVLKAASNGTKQVAVVVDAKSLFLGGRIVGDLAERGVLKLWHGGAAYPVQVTGKTLSAVLRPGLRMPLGVRSNSAARPNGKFPSLSSLREVTYAMDKTLNRGTVVVAEFGKTAKGPRRIGFGDGPSGKPGETVTVTRDDLLHGFSGNRGGTVILAGRVQDGVIRAKGGPVPLVDIRAAAAAADVHLVILDGPAKAAHKALEHAATYGDLLTGMAEKGGAITVDAQRLGENRVRLSMAPEVAPAGAAQAAPSVADDVAQVAATGIDIGVRGLVHGIEFETRDEDEERDRKLRIIPGVSGYDHVYYGINILGGIYAFYTSWWIWSLFWDRIPFQGRALRIAKAAGFGVLVLHAGIILGLIGFLTGWISWIAPGWNRRKHSST